jgi:hypothetical protein
MNFSRTIGHDASFPVAWFQGCAVKRWTKLPRGALDCAPPPNRANTGRGAERVDAESPYTWEKPGTLKAF